MKFGILFTSCVALILWVGCDNKNGEPKNKTSHEHLQEKVDRTGPEYASKYICPMHCEGSGSDTTGICPVCKMDYVLNEN